MNKMRKSYQQKFIGLLLLTAVLFGNQSAFAQVKKISATTKSQEKTECKSGYQGTVNYTKITTTTSSGKFGSTRTMRREYQAQIVVRDNGSPQGTTASASANGITGSINLNGRATASESETLDQIDVSEKDEYCNVTIKGRGTAQRVRCQSKTNDQMRATGSIDNTNIFIGLRGNTMVLSLNNLPKLSGTVNRQSSTTCSGTCTPSKDLNSSSSVETHNKGERSATTDEGVIPFNTTNFNRLSGSWTRTGTNGNSVETFQWNLSRCAKPLEIGDIRFEHKRVPNPDKWFPFDPTSGTIDGNIVKIKAKVYNNGGETAYANVRFSETNLGEQLPDGAISVAVKPGEARDIEYEWDTSGFAWNENQKKAAEREIKAELEGGNSETAKIKIKPKPVVMVHGLWANEQGWANYPIYLKNAHSYDWEGFAVGADPKNGKMNTGDSVGNWRPTNTIFQNSQELAKQIKYVRESRNAWHIDIVAHSMGGLISRHYINTFMQPVFDGKPEATHLVMLGTPNQGSPCANTVDGLFGMFGVTEMMAIKELRPTSVSKFNQINTNRKGVKFSILAGYTVRTTCHEWGLGDGVVQLPSALYNISDRDYSRNIHTELTGKDDFEKFVLPRLAVDPKKAKTERLTALRETIENKNQALPNGEEINDRYGFNQYFRNASYKKQTNRIEDDEPELNNFISRQKITLADKQTKEIEIPAEAGKLAGVLIVAAPSVSAVLTDSANVVIGKNEGGLEAMKNPFRTIFVEKSVNGKLKLKLENFDSKENVVFVAAFTVIDGGSDFRIEAGAVKTDGNISLRAKWTENNLTLKGATIIGRINGQVNEISFYDDGKHDDGAANDGVYGAIVGKLPKGEHFIEATAEANNQKRISVTPITIGESAQKKITKSTKKN